MILSYLNPRARWRFKYGEVARQCGLAGFTLAELQSFLLAAVKSDLRQSLNYGRATGLGATERWTNVIHNTFTPLIKDQVLPRDHKDIEFYCMSYDVGVQKRDTLILEATELMLAQVVAIQEGKSLGEVKADIETWRRVYVGDEYEKDVVGAVNAG